MEGGAQCGPQSLKEGPTGHGRQLPEQGPEDRMRALRAAERPGRPQTLARAQLCRLGNSQQGRWAAFPQRPGRSPRKQGTQWPLSSPRLLPSWAPWSHDSCMNGRQPQACLSTADVASLRGGPAASPHELVPAGDHSCQHLPALPATWDNCTHPAAPPETGAHPSVSRSPAGLSVSTSSGWASAPKHPVPWAAHATKAAGVCPNHRTYRPLTLPWAAPGYR